MNKAQEFLKEVRDISDLSEVAMGDEIVFKMTDIEKNLRGLKGQVRGVRNGMLDIYVGSSLRSQIDPSRVEILKR